MSVFYVTTHSASRPGLRRRFATKALALEFFRAQVKRAKEIKAEGLPKGRRAYTYTVCIFEQDRPGTKWSHAGWFWDTFSVKVT